VGFRRQGCGYEQEAGSCAALRTGISLGMTLIDTSEGYGGGRSEELIGHVISGQRDCVFLVTKVDHAVFGGSAYEVRQHERMARHCTECPVQRNSSFSYRSLARC